LAGGAVISHKGSLVTEYREPRDFTGAANAAGNAKREGEGFSTHPAHLRIALTSLGSRAAQRGTHSVAEPDRPLNFRPGTGAPSPLTRCPWSGSGVGLGPGNLHFGVKMALVVTVHARFDFART
jgi:hypothetical protein